MGSRARVDHIQCPYFLRGTVVYNQANVATGVYIGSIPSGARISLVRMWVETAQNAGTTNTLSVGTQADVNGSAPQTPATAQTQLVSAQAAGTAVYATALPPIAGTIAATDLAVYVSLAQTGTAATAGTVTVAVEYIVNL